MLALTPPLPFPLGFIPRCCCSGFKHPQVQGFLLLPSARCHTDPAPPAAEHGAGPVSPLHTPAGAQARCLRALCLQEAGRVAAGQLRAARACSWQVWYVSSEPRVILGYSVPGRLLCCRTAGAACGCSDGEITPFLTAADHAGLNSWDLHNPEGCPQEQQGSVQSQLAPELAEMTSGGTDQGYACPRTKGAFSLMEAIYVLRPSQGCRLSPKGCDPAASRWVCPYRTSV